MIGGLESWVCSAEPAQLCRSCLCNSKQCSQAMDPLHTLSKRIGLSSRESAGAAMSAGGARTTQETHQASHHTQGQPRSQLQKLLQKLPITTIMRSLASSQAAAQQSLPASPRPQPLCPALHGDGNSSTAFGRLLQMPCWCITQESQAPRCACHNCHGHLKHSLCGRHGYGLVLQ